ncbi:MAG: hypothetical protein ACOZCL_08630 [Bacillota bacterium]
MIKNISRKSVLLDIAQVYLEKMNENQNVDNKLILFTSVGIISGKPVNLLEISETESIEDLKTSSEWIIKIYNEQITAIENENPDADYIDSSARVVLTDASIITPNNPNSSVKLQEITVFSDQIIGFALGDLQVS